MKKWKYIIIAVIFLAIIGGAYGYREFHRGHKDLSAVKSDINISAGDLVRAFTNDETIANKAYLDKTIAVKGKIKSIEKDGQGLFTVLLTTDVEDKNVSCEMDIKHNEDASKMKVGDDIVMKGVCTGSLIDVVLIRCVIDN
jgi:hypothetical protein